MNRRTGWLITALVIIGVFYFQHTRTPNIPLPSQYTSAPATLTVTAAMQIPPKNGEGWTLSRTSDAKVYIVSAFNNSRLLAQFKTTGLVSSDGNGKTYGTSGKVEFSNDLYTAKTIHVNADGKTATITFSAATSGSQSTTGN